MYSSLFHALIIISMGYLITHMQRGNREGISTQAKTHIFEGRSKKKTSFIWLRLVYTTGNQVGSHLPGWTAAPAPGWGPPWRGSPGSPSSGAGWSAACWGPAGRQTGHQRDRDRTVIRQTVRSYWTLQGNTYVCLEMLWKRNYKTLLLSRTKIIPEFSKLFEKLEGLNRVS